MITYNDIKKANESIRTTNIKGKDYAEVNQRIKAFRMVNPEGGIVTELISNDTNDAGRHVAVIKAIVTNADGKELGTGTAYEVEGSSFINGTSYIENCETSAVGRALGMAGYGIDTSVCSAEEVGNAITQQTMKSPASELEKKTFLQRCEKLGVDYKQIGKQAGATSMKTMTKEQHGKALIILGEIEESKKE